MTIENTEATYRRMIEDPDYAEQVADDPDGALTDVDLTDAERDVVVADAALLGGDTAGFSAGGLRIGELGVSQGFLLDIEKKGFALPDLRTTGTGTARNATGTDLSQLPH